MAPEIRIDPEFESICPPLRDDEIAELRSDLAANGCIDPLIVWQQTGILLDGHNRFRLCRELGITFAVKELPFGGRHRALIYAIRHQLARRNLTPLERRQMIGMRYAAEKRAREETLVPGAAHREAGENRKNGAAGSDPSIPHGEGSKDPCNETARRIADEMGVSRATVERAGKFAEAVETLTQRGGPEVRRAILSGDVHLSDRDLEALCAQVVEDPDFIRSVEDLRAVAETRKADRRARPSTTDAQKPFIQRGFRLETITTRIDADDGLEYFDTCVLTCGHLHTWKRAVRATDDKLKRLKGAPCYQCGSGTRKPADDRRARARLDNAIDRAWAEPERREELRAFLRAYAVARTLRPGDARRAKLEEEMDRHFALAVDVEAA